MPVDAAAAPAKNKAVLDSNHDDSRSGYVWKAVWQTGVLTPTLCLPRHCNAYHYNVSGASHWDCLLIVPTSC